MATMPTEAATTGDTVTVACKMPGGVILRVFEPVSVAYPLPGGGSRDATEYHEIQDKRYVVSGTAHEAGKSPDARIVGGYALTYGVPKDLWELWYEQNKHSDMVKNRLIHAHGQEASIVKIAQEHSSVLSGLEPIHLDGKGQVTDGRAPRNVERATD